MIAEKGCLGVRPQHGRPVDRWNPQPLENTSLRHEVLKQAGKIDGWLVSLTESCHDSTYVVEEELIIACHFEVS